jgi:hypothetical protein
MSGHGVYSLVKDSSMLSCQILTTEFSRPVSETVTIVLAAYKDGGNTLSEKLLILV